VVPGRLDSKKLASLVAMNGGAATLVTVDGAELKVTMGGPNMLLVTDQKGDVAHVTIADVYQSNGVIHVIDKVMLPG
jgi:uncharacterized surface protein with fasciclin (FAS1) repeats